MPSINERLTALRGRLEDAGPAKDALGCLLDLCQELADHLSDLEEAQEDLALYLETIDEDLTRLEGQLFGGGEDEEDDEAPLLDLTCPYCQREIKGPRPGDHRPE